MTGVAGLAGDPAYPAHQPTMPPVPLGKTGTRYARVMNQMGLALVAFRHRRGHNAIYLTVIFFAYAHAREGKARKSASFARVAISLITLTH
jgi:hypothetical protein